MDAKLKTTQEIKEPSCEWNLTPDIWMIATSEDIVVKDQTIPLDIFFLDILKN